MARAFSCRLPAADKAKRFATAEFSVTIGQQHHSMVASEHTAHVSTTTIQAEMNTNGSMALLYVPYAIDKKTISSYNIIERVPIL